MKIGEPLRILIIEPLELTFREPEGQAELTGASEQEPEHTPEQVVTK